MAKRRMLHSSFWTSHNNLKWTMRQRLLFIGIVSNADDQGRMNAHPALIRSAVFPYDELTLAEVQADVEAIVATDAIALYEAEGQPVLQVVNWWTYQQPQWAQPSTIAPPDGWSDRIRYRANNSILSCNWRSPSGKEMPDNCTPDGTPLPGALGEPLPKASPKESARPLSSAPSDSDSDSDSDSRSTLTRARARDAGASGRPTSLRSQQDAVRAELERAFVETTSIPAPEPRRDGKGGAAARWWQPLREIAQLVDWDPEKGAALVREACERMIADGLTVAAPGSILNVAISLHAESRRPRPRSSRASPRASPAPLERTVADIPKGWLQEPFDPDEEPQL